MKNIKQIFAIVLVSVIWFQNVIAQDSTKLKSNRKYYDFSFGMGIGSGYPSNVSGIKPGGNIGLNIKWSNNILSVSAKGITDFQILSTSDIQNNVNDVEFSYGKPLVKGVLAVNLLGGISYNTFTQKGKLISTTGCWFCSNSNFQQIETNNIGFPITIQLNYLFFKNIGVGLELFLNLNNFNNFYGANFNLHFGKLRPVLTNKKGKKY